MIRFKELLMIAVASSTFFGSCTKSDTAPYEVSKTILNNATSPDLSKCKIRRIYQQTGPWTIETALFTYNATGNPYSVVYSHSGTSHPNHFFFYDSKNRLKEYQMKWGDYYIH